jgi:hypothetical protein
MHAYERGALRFGVTDSGPPDADVVILLHGFPQQPRGFAGVVERLNAAGLRTLISEPAGLHAHGPAHSASRLPDGGDGR